MTSNIYEKFYQNGYYNLSYIDKKSSNNLNNRISHLILEESKWKKKYKFSKDLKHEFLKEEDVFYDFIDEYEGNVPRSENK